MRHLVCFVATVAEGRASLTADAILAMEAGTYIGADAVAVGLADAVGSFEGVLADLSGQMGTTTPAKIRGRAMNDPNMIARADHDSAIPPARSESSATTGRERERIAASWDHVFASRGLAVPSSEAALQTQNSADGWDDMFRHRGMNAVR